MKQTTYFALCFVLFLLLSFNVSAETIIDQDILSDASWTSAGSPYNITTTVRLCPTCKLNIGQGVEIVFSPNAKLISEVTSQIIAFGGWYNQIIFRSENNAPFTLEVAYDYDSQRQNFTDTLSLCTPLMVDPDNFNRFTYVTFFGGDIRFGKTVMTHTNINSPNVSFYGSFVNGAMLNGPSLFVSKDADQLCFNGCTFTDIELDGLIGKMIGNSFNGKVPNTINAINFGNNRFRNLEGSSVINVERNFVNNFIVNSQQASNFSLEINAPVVKYNVFNNFTTNSVLTISTNEFVSNSYVGKGDVYLQVSQSTKNEYNSFQLDSGKVYIMNPSTQQLDLRNNYWFTTDPNSIQNLIIDNQEYTSKGVALYNPFLTTPIYPNPFVWDAIYNYYSQNMYMKYYTDLYIANTKQLSNITNSNTTQSNSTNPNSPSILTPTISSFTTSSTDLYFQIEYGVQSTPFEHMLFVGSPSFKTATCSYDGQFTTMNLTVQSSSQTIVRYVSNQLPIDYFLNHPSVAKEILSDTIKLTIPLKLAYFNHYGIGNNGYCQSIEYETSQILYFKLVATAMASFNTNLQLFPSSINIYPQLVSLTSSFQKSTFKIEAIVQTVNMSVVDFTVYNSSNSNYNLGISLFESYSNSSSTTHAYRFIASSTQTNSLKDFRAMIYFKASTVYDLWQYSAPSTFYIPFSLDYVVVVPPSDKNVTLQLTMGVYDNTWMSKSKFSSEERVYSLVQSLNYFTNYKVSIESSYLCCFTSIVSAPVYDPSNNQLGCTVKQGSMDLWKELIVNYQATTDLSTNLHTFPSNIMQGFSFKLSSNLFTSVQDRFCYLHANVRLVSLQTRRAVENVHIISSISQDTVSPYATTYLSINAPEQPQGSTKLSSTSVSIPSFILMFILVLSSFILY